MSLHILKNNLIKSENKHPAQKTQTSNYIKPELQQDKAVLFLALCSFLLLDN